MKYTKILGLLAVVAAALLAFAGTASAELTKAPGVPVDAGETIHAHSSNTQLTGSVAIKCEESTVHGTITTKGGTYGVIHELTFDKCGNDTVDVLNAGSLSIDSSGTVTSTGAEVTIQLHRTIFGFPITTHCIYKTNATDVGKLEGGTEAKLNIGSVGIPQTTTDGACGNDAVWEGSYTITTPHYLALS